MFQDEIHNLGPVYVTCDTFISDISCTSQHGGFRHSPFNKEEIFCGFESEYFLEYFIGRMKNLVDSILTTQSNRSRQGKRKFSVRDIVKMRVSGVNNELPRKIYYRDDPQIEKIKKGANL